MIDASTEGQHHLTHSVSRCFSLLSSSSQSAFAKKEKFNRSLLSRFIFQLLLFSPVHNVPLLLHHPPPSVLNCCYQVLGLGIKFLCCLISGKFWTQIIINSSGNSPSSSSTASADRHRSTSSSSSADHISHHSWWLWSVLLADGLVLVVVDQSNLNLMLSETTKDERRVLLPKYNLNLNEEKTSSWDLN